MESVKFRNAKKFQKNLQKVIESLPGIKNEFPITLITRAKKCLKKPLNAISNPPKVSRVSTLSLFISPEPKTLPKSNRVHSDEPNGLQNEVILENFKVYFIGSMAVKGV